MVDVRAEMGDQHVGPEPGDGRHDDPLDRAQERLAPGERRERDVDRRPQPGSGAALGHAAGSREDVLAVFVDGDGEHARVVVEEPLHAVAVVGVDIDVCDALGAGVEERSDREGAVVVDAEPGGTVGERVMKPRRGGAVDGVGRAAGDEVGGGQRGPADAECGFVHPRPGGGVAAGRKPPLAGLPRRGELRVGAVAAHRGHVGRRVDELYLLRLGGLRRDDGHILAGQQAVGVDQVNAEPPADRSFDVVARVVRLQVRSRRRRRCSSRHHLKRSIRGACRSSPR